MTPTQHAFDRLVAERLELHEQRLELSTAVGEFLAAYFAPERMGPNPPVKSGERVAYAVQRLGELVPTDVPAAEPEQLELGGVA